VLRPFNIIEMVRTGQVVMTRSLRPELSQQQEQETDRPKPAAQTVEASHSV
jgi:hypothetical protein